MIFKGIRNKRALTVIVFLVFLLTVFTIPSIANASNPPDMPLYYGMTGFNGNDTIYMTTAIGSSFHDSPILGNITSHGTANTSCCPVRPTYPHYVCNAVGLATGSNYTYKYNSQYSLSEYNTEGNRLSVYIPLAASGLSFVIADALKYGEKSGQVSLA